MNEQITEFLKRYCAADVNPGYAIFIKGPWGSGKSWYMEQVISEVSGGARPKHKAFLDRFRQGEKAKPDRTTFIMISLYGVSTIDEIKSRLFQAAYPLLSNPIVSLCGSLVASHIGLPPMSAADALKVDPQAILVFDDLERSKLPITELLGFINTYIELQGRKVILIGDETRMDVEQTQDEIKKYNTIKEKVVGKTVEIKPNFEAAFKTFVASIQSDAASRFVGDRINIVREIYDLSGFDNLRHLKRALTDFELLYDALDAKVKKKNELVEHLLKLLLAYSFEISSGQLDISDAPNLVSRCWATAAQYLNSGKNAETIEPILCKHRVIIGHHSVVTNSGWLSILDTGIVDASAMNQALLSSEYFYDENTAEWKQLWRFDDLDNPDFDRLYARMKQKYDAGEYVIIGEFLHVVGIMLSLKKAGFANIASTEEEIVNVAKKYVDAWKANGNLRQLSPYDDESFYSDAHDHLCYRENKDGYFKDIEAYLNKIRLDIYSENLPDECDTLLQLMKEDTLEFGRSLCFSNENAGDYYRIPILAQIDPIAFHDALLSLPQKRRLLVSAAMRQRYDNNCGGLKSEIDFLNGLLDIMKHHTYVGVDRYVFKTRILETLTNGLKCLNAAST